MAKRGPKPIELTGHRFELLTPIRHERGGYWRCKCKCGTLADPTILWFWKTHPKKDESVVVSFAAANSPSIFKIRFTYQGIEEIEVAGKKIQAHEVREDPLDVAKGNEVFTIRWFDDKGMDIQRYHIANKNEYRTKLVNWR